MNTDVTKVPKGTASTCGRPLAPVLAQHLSPLSGLTTTTHLSPIQWCLVKIHFLWIQPTGSVYSHVVFWKEQDHHTNYKSLAVPHVMTVVGTLSSKSLEDYIPISKHLHLFYHHFRVVPVPAKSRDQIRVPEPGDPAILYAKPWKAKMVLLRRRDSPVSLPEVP